MRARCENKNNPAYKAYGGRGIKVCERWQRFESFLADMVERPAGLSIDRIDNDGDYTPENCRWATRAVQNNNSRHNVWIEIGNERHTAAEWGRIAGLPKRALLRRIRAGWPVERAILP